jgi:hypothetical protein
MKYLILIIFYFGLIKLHADDCGTRLSCDPAIQYPYINCNDITVCSNNPLSLTPQVRRPNMPICLISDPKDGPTITRLPTMTGLETVFEMSKIQADIDCATYKWNCICGKESTACDQGCTITLK